MYSNRDFPEIEGHLKYQFFELWFAFKLFSCRVLGIAIFRAVKGNVRQIWFRN